jgi:hypothetical protein
MRSTFIRRRGALPAALLSAAALAASGLVAAVAPANAVITTPGGLNDQNVPAFYRDAQGLALQLCVDANEVRCEPPADGHIGVYFAADATAGPMNAIYAVEAAVDEDTGAPVVSNGARFRFTGARPNTTYRIRDPWGSTNCRTDATGGADCRLETGGAFGAVRTGHITTFLRSVRNPAGLFIGNADVASRVAGSPSGFNRITVTGGGRTFRTNQFTIMGEKRANTAMSSVSSRALALGRPQRAEPVVRNIRYASFGTAAARPTVRVGGQNPGAFRVRNTCGSQAPGSACNFVVTFRPRQFANRTARAVLTVDDNSLAAPRQVRLRGVGLRR